MATSMKQVLGTVYAYEYAETLVSEAGEKFGEDVFIPPNVAQIGLGIRRKSGSGRYKVQITYSTRSEIFDSGNAEWFNWDVPSADPVTGYIDLDEITWWIPIPSGIRIVAEAGAGTTIYFSMRAN